jgi:hypothetical protein
MTTQTKQKTKFPILDVFMASAMAFRINGDYVNSWVQDPNSEEVKSKPLNKDIMREHFVTGAPALTEADVEVGKLMHEHFKGILLKKLTKQLNQFENAIAELVMNDEVSRFEFGLIASLAKVYYRDLKVEGARESIASIGYASQYIENSTATAGNFFLDVNILTTLRLPAYNCWTVIAKTKDNNLVGFYMKQDPAPYVGKETEIRCRVKDRKPNRDGFKVTYLNYVKLLSEEV